jgi:sugar transferase (PEP-CTERM system associated)
MSAVLLHLSHRTLVLVAFESALIVAGVAIAAPAGLGTSVSGIAPLSYPAVVKVALVATVCQLCLYLAGLYDAGVMTDRGKAFLRLLQPMATTSAMLAVVYFWFPSVLVKSDVFAIGTVLVIAAVIGWRVAFAWVVQRAGPRERLLLIGTTDASVTLARELFNKRLLGIEVVGFVDPDPARVGHTLCNTDIIGTIGDIAEIVRQRRVDRVVVNLADARGRLPMDTLLDLRLRGIVIDHLATVYERYTGKIALENLRPSWFIFSSGFRYTRPLAAAKRCLDVAIGVIGLVLAAPLMCLVGAAVKLTSPGPVLYSQRRVGQNGCHFIIRKFRSMRVDAEAESGAVWATAHDRRVTPIGRLLRRTRLDELPQLWNVLVGDMSLVGPRPERPEFVGDLEREIQFYGQRHVVKPGLTGWAQISYPYGATVADALQKLQYDLYYLKHMSFGLDLLILFATMKTVVSRTGH